MRKQSPGKEAVPALYFLVQTFQATYSPCSVVSPTLGLSYSRPTLPTPQPDPAVKLFCFEKQFFSFQAWIDLITSGWIDSPPPHLPTRQGVVYTSRLFLFSDPNWSISSPDLFQLSASWLLLPTSIHWPFHCTQGLCQVLRLWSCYGQDSCHSRKQLIHPGFQIGSFPMICLFPPKKNPGFQPEFD